MTATYLRRMNVYYVQESIEPLEAVIVHAPTRELITSADGKAIRVQY